MSLKPTQVIYLPMTSYCIFYPFALQPVWGIFMHGVHSLNEKNMTTELRMLCEETNRKCNIYNSLSVYFVFFSFFNFFQVKMQQLAFFFCVCAIAMVSFGCTPDACLMVLPILQHMSLTSCENTDFVKLSPGCAVGEDNPFKVSSVNMALKSDLKLVSRYLLFSDIKKSCSWSYY